MALSLCPSSKHALGSHEYIQYCRKFGVDIRLQLMEQKAVRGDLARTVRVCPPSLPSPQVCLPLSPSLFGSSRQ